MIKNTRGTFKIILLLFAILFITFISLLFYHFRQNNFSFFRKNASKFTIEDTGFITAKPLDENPNKPTRKYLFLESTSRVNDIELKDSVTFQKIGDASSVEFQFKNINGNLEKIKIIVQIRPEGSEKNAIPWFNKDALRERTDSVYSDQMFSEKELSELYPKGSKWLFIPLTESFLEELQLTYNLYVEIARKYYTADDWLEISNFFEGEKIADLNNSKPFLILRLNYVP